MSPVLFNMGKSLNVDIATSIDYDAVIQGSVEHLTELFIIFYSVLGKVGT